MLTVVFGGALLAATKNCPLSPLFKGMGIATPGAAKATVVETPEANTIGIPVAGIDEGVPTAVPAQPAASKRVQR